MGRVTQILAIIDVPNFHVIVIFLFIIPNGRQLFGLFWKVLWR